MVMEKVGQVEFLVTLFRLYQKSPLPKYHLSCQIISNGWGWPLSIFARMLKHRWRPNYQRLSTGCS